MSGTGQRGRWEFDEQGNCRFVPDPEHDMREGRQNSSGYERKNARDSQRRQWENTEKQKWQSGNMPDSTQKKGDGWQWALIIGLFIFGLWPVAVILLILKSKGLLNSGNGSQTADAESWQNVARHVQEQVAEAGHEVKKGLGRAYRNAQSEIRSARENAAAYRQDEQTSDEDTIYEVNSRQKRRAWLKWAKAHGLGHIGLFRTFGAILTGVFGLSLLLAITDGAPELGLLLVLMSFFAGGVSLLGVAGLRSRKLKRYQRYLTLIGSRHEIAVADVARTLGYTEKRVSRDFQDMLDCGVFERGYLDVKRQLLILGEWSPEPEEEEEAASASAAASANASVAALRRIRDINNNIADPAMSDKIDRIEVVTAKILRLLEENPEKADELRSFLNYYLPETMNILERYSKLEAQGVDSGNIAAAKQQIEETTDKLVKAFETQLDKLFESDVLDISADLKVMETMLEKDGLTDDGLHL